MNSCQLRRNAPKARTYLEVIRYRWGRLGHATFMFFGLATNLLVTSMLITGGSATVSALTGMHTAAACALIPLPVMLYVAVGGMRASLYADYLVSYTTELEAVLMALYIGTAQLTTQSLALCHSVRDDSRISLCRVYDIGSDWQSSTDV